MLAALATGAVDSVKTEEAAKVETDSSVGSVETFTDEDDEFTATLGAVHQAVLDNNVAKVGSLDHATQYMLPHQVERLIQEDFPLDERDAHSLTPLHLAVSLGRPEVCDL